MKYDPTKYNRGTIRLKDYDYSQSGMYFITICTSHKQCFMGSVTNGEIELSYIGKIARKYWQEIPYHFKNIILDAYVIMPNHIHGIIVIRNVGAQYIEPLPQDHESQRNKYQHIIPKSIGSIILAYKSAVTRWCNINNFTYFEWQRNFYDHIIRNDKELNAIRQYVTNNPLKWQLDRENPTSKNYNIDHDIYFKEVYIQ